MVALENFLETAYLWNTGNVDVVHHISNDFIGNFGSKTVFDINAFATILKVIGFQFYWLMIDVLNVYDCAIGFKIDKSVNGRVFGIALSVNGSVL